MDLGGGTGKRRRGKAEAAGGGGAALVLGAACCALLLLVLHFWRGPATPWRSVGAAAEGVAVGEAAGRRAAGLAEAAPFVESFLSGRGAGKDAPPYSEYARAADAARERALAGPEVYAELVHASRRRLSARRGGSEAAEEPPRASRLPPSPRVTVSAQGQSCSDACAVLGLQCSEAALARLNTCEALRDHMDCSRGCSANFGPDQPAQVAEPSDPKRGECLFTTGATSCGGSHPVTVRLCACGPPPS